MSVASGDIKVYGSTYMQESDAGFQGSGIDLTTQVLFDSYLWANDPSGGLKVVSSSAVDTGIMLLTWGRNAAGSIISGAIPISGLTTTSGTAVFERLMKVAMSGTPTHTGTITVYDKGGSNVIVTIPSGILKVRRPFYDVSSDVSINKYYYEKVYVRNNNTVNALLGANISEVAGGVASSIDFDIETMCNTNVGYFPNWSSGRTSYPTSGMQTSNLGAFDSNAKSLTIDTDLQPTGAIGVWMKLTLNAGASAQKSFYTLAVSGSST